MNRKQAAYLGGQALVHQLRQEGGPSAVREYYRDLSNRAENRGRPRRPSYDEIVATRRGARLRDRIDHEGG